MKPREAIEGAQLLLVMGLRPDLAACVEAVMRRWVDVVQLRKAR